MHSSARYGSIKDDTAEEARAQAPVRTAPTAKAAAAPKAAPVVAEKAPVAAAPMAPSPAPTAAKQAATPPPAAPTTVTAVPAAPQAPVVAPGAPKPSAEQVDAQTTERQLEEGRVLFQAGNVIEARKRFIAAMNGPIPDALLALARSFDTFYLSKLPKSDGAPDMARALTLYERAVERGAPEAAPDLERIKATMVPAAPPKQ